jgi:hypothetical protein
MALGEDKSGAEGIIKSNKIRMKLYCKDKTVKKAHPEPATDAAKKRYEN